MLDATERKALTLSAFTASCICFAPGEIVSGFLLLTISAVLWRWDEKLLRREAAAAAALGQAVPVPAASSGGEADPPAAAAE
jgi:hypothetical protein